MRLITIPVSHYCEKVRWALEWYGIPYVEESHPPLFHRFATRKQGGRSVPVLVTKTDSFTDSTDILRYLETLAQPSKRLYPEDPDRRREVEDLEELFDTKLGVHSRCWAYFYQLNNPQAMRKAWGTGVSSVEEIGLAIAFPFIVRLVKKSLNVTASSAEISLQEIQRIFQIVSERLVDSQSYLVGESLTLADLTFAALAAPVLRPPEHPLKPAPLDEIPPAMARTVRELRSTIAGIYGLRLYREHRRLTPLLTERHR